MESRRFQWPNRNCPPPFQSRRLRSASRYLRLQRARRNWARRCAIFRVNCPRASNWSRCAHRSRSWNRNCYPSKRKWTGCFRRLRIRWRCGSRKPIGEACRPIPPRGRDQLLTWANNAQAAIQKLDEQEPIWAATLRENQGAHDLDPVVALIANNLSDIRKLRAQAKDELQTIVTMQIQASADVEMAGNVLDRLAQARKQLTGHLLHRDSLPLWQIATRREAGENSPELRHDQQSQDCD